jgi:hypothetical protein
MPAHAASAESAPGRFPNLLQARCPKTLPRIIERAAQSQCMTASEYIRRSVVERLLHDGFKIDIEPQQYALVENGAVAIVGPANNRRIAIATKLDEGDPRTWLPVENEDSEPFDPARHWRLAPTYRVDGYRVVRTYPVIPKSMEAM